MLFRKFFMLFLLIVSFSLLISAQKKDDYVEQERDRLEAEQRLEQTKELVESNTRSDFIDLTFFLPESKDSWTLSVTAHGGFAGGTRLLAAVNSNGNYLCSPRQEFKNRLLEKVVLDPVFSFVEKFDFSKLENNDAKSIKGCMDCAYTTLALQTRQGIFRHTRNDFYNAEGEVKEIYDHLSNLTECR